jgi:5-methylcytosine-specific restriction endonuclease McrA
MAVTARLRAEVARRARYHCEYCGYPEAASSTPLEVDHIIPEARGGPTTFNNLALCCRRCNLHKHVQTEAVDPAPRSRCSYLTRARSRGLRTLRWTATRVQCAA